MAEKEADYLVEEILIYLIFHGTMDVARFSN